MGSDVERIAPPYTERDPRHTVRLQPPCHRCHNEGARGRKHRPTCLRVLVRPRRVMASSRTPTPNWRHKSLKSPPPWEIQVLLLLLVTIFAVLARRARGQKFIVTTVVAGTLSDSWRAPRLRQWAEEGVWRAKAVFACGVREFVSEMRESTMTFALEGYNAQKTGHTKLSYYSSSREGIIGVQVDYKEM
jgi:hypothetical protein